MYVRDEEFEREMLTLVENPIDSWLDREFLESVADDIVHLMDYVPKRIELALPDYQKRKDFYLAHDELISSDYYQITQIADQMAACTTWEEHVGVYDNFFRRHPEFSKLIKDEDEYMKWRIERPPYAY